MKLLLATDGSPDATAALSAAARVFRNEEVEADLLCVVPRLHTPNSTNPDERSRTDRVTTRYEARMTREAEQILAGAVETLRGEGLDAHARTDFGSPGDAILRLGADYDVTVVGAHDRLGRTQLGVGPVGSQVISRSSGSILIGRESASGAPARILLCVDGSTASAKALERMVTHARLDDVEVTIIHVVELPWLRLGLDADWPDPASRDEAALLDDAVRDEASRILEQAGEKLKKQGVSSHPVVREGLPEAQILSEAEMGEYDLIVLGATGRSQLTHVTAGSVAIRVAEYAPANVWLVR